MPVSHLRLFIFSLCLFLAAATRADCMGSAQAPYPCSDLLSGIEFNWASHRRYAVESDNWPVTWANDDAQYAAWGDGYGLTRIPGETRTFSLGISRLAGSPEKLRGKDIYHGAEQNCHGRDTWAENGALCGKTYGLLALDSDRDGKDELLMWLSPGSGKRNLMSARLFYSKDFGQSWKKTPVEFHRNEGLITPAFIQFGRSLNAIKQTGLDPDYVYIYAIQPSPGHPRDLAIQRPGNIYLLRAPQREMGHKSAYQYYTGEAPSPWSANPARKQPVFHDPHGVGWNLSAIYMPHLKRYLLITEHDRSFRGKPGFFESKTPWGPWKTVAYFDNWAKQTNAPASAGGRQAFFWNFSPKWSNEDDARDFTLIYSGIGEQDDSLNIVRGRFDIVLPPR